MNFSKNLLIGGGILVVGIAAFFIYITRPVAEPSEAPNPTVNAIVTTQPTQQEEFVYTIDSSQSEARFAVDEVLRGEDFTAVGTTNQIQGEITVNDQDIATANVGTVRVNARTLETDSRQRDGAISRLILRSEDSVNEFITFEPTLTTPTIITGNLTIAGVTRETTFTGQMSLNEAKQIEGAYQTTVLRSDFNLTIPNVPFVASVSDEVLLSIDFVAT